MAADLTAVSYLNQAIRAETEAIVWYETFSAALRSWRYDKMSKKVHSYAKDEMGHLKKFSVRLAEMDGMLDTSRVIRPIPVGASPVDHIQAMLALEQEAVALYNKALVECAMIDGKTADLFEHALKDESHHLAHLKGWMDQIAQMGVQNFLASQL